jgi:starch-binding outer membrane protein, SusD/RagB family
MKTMKMIRHITVAMLLLVMAGCDDSYLDITNKFGANTDTFYKKKADFDAALGGVYNSLYISGGNVFAEEHITASLLDDTMLGGGGPDDQGAKNVDAFVDPNDDTYQDLWKETYNGILRANLVIEKLAVTDLSDDFADAAEEQAYKNAMTGEMYFMRGFLLFRAAKFFGGMPLITNSTTPRNVPRATFSETFGQIAADLKQGIELLPAIDPAAIPLSEYGHTNHWIAQAILARVYLFYTGYMTNIEGQATTEILLPGDAGSISKQYVIDQLTDCVNNSGYALVSDFRNLWPYSYVNESAGSVKYPWADNEGLKWVGQDGFNSAVGTGNTEVMFPLRYTFADWGWTLGQRTTNRSSLFMALRGNSGLTPFGEGWGWGTIHTDFFNQWDNNDLRKQGSVLQVGVEDEGTAGYSGDKGDHETGLFNKKYIHLEYDNGGMKGLFNYVYNWPNTDMQLRHAQDFYYVRFADVLLMLSELTEDAQYMNMVRARADLEPVTYSLDALKQERLHELAFEGLRWFDLVRWGDVNDPAKNFFENTIQVRNSGSAASYKVTYRAETKGLVSIPESEIRLSDGVYNQNPGW